MSTLDLSGNNLSGLDVFRETKAYNELVPQERGVLEQYANLQKTRNMDERNIVQISGINDPTLGEYGGVGTVKVAVKSLYTDGVELPYFIGERPYLFFVNPETSEFWFFKNSDVYNTTNQKVEVLDISAGKWVHVDNPELFFGEGEAAENYPGLIKSHFFVVQFNRDEGRMLQQRDKIEFRVAEESLDSKKRGEKYFCEQQKSSYCQIHAANAFLGYPAIRPNALAEYIKIKVTGFEHQHVEGLAAGGYPSSNDAAAVFDIENGIDLGIVIDYLSYLESESTLRMSVAEIKVGKLSYSEKDGLVFANDVTGEKTQVDDAFLASKSRAMIGTYAPIHAKAARKNTDGSWSEVDSFLPAQKVHSDFKQGLIKTVISQEGFQGNTTTLPCVFL